MLLPVEYVGTSGPDRNTSRHIIDTTLETVRMQYFFKEADDVILSLPHLLSRRSFRRDVNDVGATRTMMLLMMMMLYFFLRKQSNAAIDVLNREESYR